ncbi:MAG: aldehyde dehydrogenase family protein, partial [Proteobacteria bacterium]|nr:aldehyde dehydrogenase family protein [Pseudomonadota bacterium]
KGAYWDYEIKQSQIKGYESYPVFTLKDNTDLNYLVCAKKLIQIKELKCKFATHNAHTIAAVYSLAKQFQKSVEFQRLFGMGELIYKNANSILKEFPNVSIYAPVGAYKDLLPYLVRRLLENGANSSFVNRLFDKSLKPEVLIESPLSKITAKKKTKASIPNPELLFKNRLNSQGFDMSEAINLERLQASLKGWETHKFKARCFSALGVTQSSPEARLVIGTTKKLGTIEALSLNGQQNLSGISVSSTWKDFSTAERAEVLHKVANALEENRDKFLYLLINEAGKTLRDAVDEVREAVDFLRYYAEEAKATKSNSQELEGPTGERNILEFVPKGIFVCISPWNFPLAITCGQIAGALVCGN